MSQTSLLFCQYCKTTQTHRAAIDADGRSIIVCMGCRMYLPGPAMMGERNGMPTINIIESSTLHYQNSSENSDKVYIVQLVEASGMYGVRFAYGPRVGRALMTGWKCGGVNERSAEAVYSNLVGEKTSKGYEYWEAGFGNYRPDYRPDWKEPPWRVRDCESTPRNEEMAAALKTVKTPKPQPKVSPPKDEENQEEMGIRARLFEIWSMSEAEQVALKPEVEKLEQKLKELEDKKAALCGEILDKLGIRKD